MTELLYQTDSYLQEFEANVLLFYRMNVRLFWIERLFIPAVEDNPATSAR